MRITTPPYAISPPPLCTSSFVVQNGTGVAASIVIAAPGAGAALAFVGCIISWRNDSAIAALARSVFLDDNAGNNRFGVNLFVSATTGDADNFQFATPFPLVFPANTAMRLAFGNVAPVGYQQQLTLFYMTLGGI